MRASRYCTFLATVVMGSLAVIAAVNLVLDPYDLKRASSAAAGSATVVESRGAFLRAALAVRAHAPRTVILGTSRAHAALRSDHPAFGAGDVPVLNLALAASSIDQIRLLLIHAHTVSGVRKAIVGLDLESFFGAGRPDFDAAALAGNPETETAWRVHARTALSRDAVVASVHKVLSPNEATRASYDDELKELGGVRGMFWITEVNNFYARLPDLFPSPRGPYSWREDPRLLDSMRAFRDMLRYARANGIDLRLFISPVHARYLEWYRRVGWWPLFEAWKRAMVEAIAEEAGAQAGLQAYPLLDFSGFHAFATEPVPKLKDLAKRMAWYRESSHYSLALGDLILARVMAPASGESGLPDGRIEVANIERHLEQIAADGERYRETQPWEAANVREMVAYLRRIARK